MKRRKKQEDYFTREIAPYYNQICRFVRRLGCEKTLAEDIAQETMETAWEHIDELMDIDYAVNWIFTVAKNKYYDDARLAFHKYEYISEPFNFSDHENARIIKDITGIILSRESHEIIEQALSLLDNRDSDLIRMRYFGDFTYHEMSEKLGINENTIRSTVMRGIHKLDKILKDLGYTKEDM